MYELALLLSRRQQPTYLLLLVSNRKFVETNYATVIAHVNMPQSTLNCIRKIMVEQTGVSEYAVEDMKNAVLVNIEEILPILQAKEEVAGHLKQITLKSCR